MGRTFDFYRYRKTRELFSRQRKGGHPKKESYWFVCHNILLSHFLSQCIILKSISFHYIVKFYPVYNDFWGDNTPFLQLGQVGFEKKSAALRSI